MQVGGLQGDGFLLDWTESCPLTNSGGRGGGEDGEDDVEMHLDGRYLTEIAMRNEQSSGGSQLPNMSCEI